MDQTNEVVYAAISTQDGAATTYKGNFIMKCDIILTAGSCTYVASQTNFAGDDYQPLALSWFSGDRVLGIGAATQDTVVQSSDKVYLWIEKTAAANDHYYAWEVTLSQARTLNFIETYRTSASSVYVTAFDSEASELYLIKWGYSYSAGAGDATEFTPTYEAQLVSSYCNTARACTIGASTLTTSGTYEGNTAETLLYFAGSSANHFDTYSN